MTKRTKAKPTRKQLERKVRELQNRIRAVVWLRNYEADGGRPDPYDWARVLNLREKDWRICV